MQSSVLSTFKQACGALHSLLLRLLRSVQMAFSASAVQQSRPLMQQRSRSVQCFASGSPKPSLARRAQQFAGTALTTGACACAWTGWRDRITHPSACTANSLPVLFSPFCLRLTGLLAFAPAAFAADGVAFSLPSSGASVASPVHVEMKVQGLEVRPAGERDGIVHCA